MIITITKPGHVVRNMIYVQVRVNGHFYDIGTNSGGERWSTLHSHGPTVPGQEQEAKEAAIAWAASHPDDMKRLREEAVRSEAE
jgi:hypothetical protein